MPSGPPPDLARPSQTDKAPAVSRAIKVLQLLAEGGPTCTLSDLARRLGFAKSSTANLCAALEDGGLITRNEMGYALGWGLVDLAGAFLRAFDPVQEFYRITSDDAVLRTQTTHLAVLDDTDALFIAKNGGRGMLDHSLHVGDKLVAARSAVGRALLAQLPPPELERRFSGPGQPSPSQVDLPSLKAQLRDVRDHGFAVDEGEVYVRVVSLAVAVPMDSAGRPAMAVGVAMPIEVASRDHREDLLHALRAAAERLTGWGGAWGQVRSSPPRSSTILTT